MYSGVIVPLVTPLTGDLEVCRQSVRQLIESVRPHVSALMPALSTGEGWLLTERQWRDMVDSTRRYAGGLPVLAGVELPTTAEVIGRARLAAELGADAVVVTTPFGGELSQQQIVDHYREVRAGAPIPLFVYHEEAISGNRIGLETLIRICELTDVVGVKESSGSAELTRELVAAGTGVPVFEGWEHLLSAVPGVAGLIGPLANLDPGRCAEMLAEPTPMRQAEIDALCQKYGLFEEEWYCNVKRELNRREVITTARTCADREVHHAG